MLFSALLYNLLEKLKLLFIFGYALVVVFNQRDSSLRAIIDDANFSNGLKQGIRCWFNLAGTIICFIHLKLKFTSFASW